MTPIDKIKKNSNLHVLTHKGTQTHTDTHRYTLAHTETHRHTQTQEQECTDAISTNTIRPP